MKILDSNYPQQTFSSNFGSLKVIMWRIALIPRSDQSLYWPGIKLAWLKRRGGSRKNSGILILYNSLFIEISRIRTVDE